MAFFKVAYAEESKTAYVWNSGCNFRCTGCYYKLKPELNTAERTVGTDEIKNALLRLSKSGKGVDKVHFLGGEPTIAHDLGELARFSKEVLGAGTHVVTNGSNPLDASVVDSASISVKAPSKERYDEYIGTGKYDVFANVTKAHRDGIRLGLSSVLIPGNIDAGDLEEIAGMIAGLDPETPYHIIGYMPVPGAPWRKATPEEVAEAEALARTHLKNVTSSCPSPEDFEYKSARIL